MSLETRDLAVVIGRRQVLCDVSIAFASGAITGLVGPNGAGKSTLMRALAGIVRPSAGEVELDGRSLRDMQPQDRARRIAFLPQERAVHWPLAVRRIVALGRLPHGGAAAKAGAAVETALAAMDVAHLADRSASEVSGGELARVLFARALAQEADVILADEPTAGLDPAHALELFEVLARLAAGGRTVVVALHDLSLAARFCHHIVMLASGRVAAAGPPAATLEPRHLAAVFGVDAAVGVIGGVPVVAPIRAAAPEAAANAVKTGVTGARDRGT